MSNPIRVDRELIGKTIFLGAKTEEGKIITEKGTCTAIMVSTIAAVHVNGAWHGINESNSETDPDDPTPWVITGVDS